MATETWPVSVRMRQSFAQSSRPRASAISSAPKAPTPPASVGVK